MASIHSTAVVSPKAILGDNVQVGPYCIIEDHVHIGDGCRLEGHSVVKAGTTLGPNNHICEGAVLGGRPQHLRAGERVGKLRIGKGNSIRENATIHCALKSEDFTVVGDGNLIMVNAHLAHDCVVGDETIIANNVMLAGHVTIGDKAYLSGGAAAHQFCRIGRLAMISGLARVSQDVPPFVTLDGETCRVVGLNLVGLRRAGLPMDEIRELKDAYRLIYRSDLAWSDMLEVLANTFTRGPAAEFHPFLIRGQRGFASERNKVTRADSSSTPRILGLRNAA